MSNFRLWSNVPASKYWGAQSLTSNPSSEDIAELTLSRKRSPSKGLPNTSQKVSLNYYDYAGEEETDYSETELLAWVSEGEERGVVRVFHPGSSYSELIRCTKTTDVEKVLSKCVADELYIHCGNQKSQVLNFDSNPLAIQNQYLADIGHFDAARIQLEGVQDDLCHMIKFVAGQDSLSYEDRVQLACTLRVKETGAFGYWWKRFCVLCGTKLYIFSSAQPKGKPSSVFDLTGGRVMEQADKKHFYCIEVSNGKKSIWLSFDSRYQQSVWLKRAAKLVSKNPVEANLSRCSLERVPNYLFLNDDLAALNLSHNCMLESLEDSHKSLPSGWINDLHHFSRLRILSLSDNGLVYFPVSVCEIKTLTELDLSCNAIQGIPEEIKQMKGLETLLLHANQLSALPYHFNELQSLSTLVIAFNQFPSVPHIVKELSSLKILNMAGNMISSLPEDIHRIQTLQLLDVRFNNISSDLPTMVAGLHTLFALNLKENSLTELNLRRLKQLQTINCSSNSIRTLTLSGGRLKTFVARNNRLVKLSMSAVCESLTILDVSRNELSNLPEGICHLQNLQKISANRNKLSSLPKNLFASLKKLKLIDVSNNRLVTFPDNLGSSPILEIIDLHCNKLQHIPDDLLAKCKRLQLLNVSNNPLTHLPTVPLPDKHNLVELKAADCALSNESLECVASLKKLKLLHLSHNNITVIPHSTLQDMSLLQYLDISSNRLKIFPTLHGCYRLRCLSLHDNMLSVCPTLSEFNVLETLDLAGNQLKRLPKLGSLLHMKSLDVSRNPQMVITEEDGETLKNLQRLGLDGVGEVCVSLKNRILTDTNAGGRLWTIGSTVTRGTSLSKPSNICMYQVCEESFREKDGLFAVIDGGRSSKAAQALKQSLSQLVEAELQLVEGTRRDNDELVYLKHAFLTAHRKLGEIGQKYGSSIVLCHIRKNSKNNGYTLNVANTGLTEAILCKGAHVVPLATAHNPESNKEEIARVISKGGYISEDSRVNGVCGVSRLVGCYYLHPHVIPLPTTLSVSLQPTADYIVMGNNGLWRYITHNQILQVVRSLREPSLAAKKLGDLATAAGCQLDVSVLVIKLDLPGKSNPANSLEVPVPLGMVPSSPNLLLESSSEETLISEGKEDEKEENEDDENEITNIDDLLVDEDVELSPQKPPELQTPIYNGEVFAEDEGEEDIDTAKEEEEEEKDVEEEEEEEEEKDEEEEEEEEPPVPLPRPNIIVLNEDITTLPRDSASSRAPNNKKPNFSIETSFESTQSMPATLEEQGNVSQSSAATNVETHLSEFNMAMYKLEDGSRTYSGRVMRRKSFVQSSYEKLSRQFKDDTEIHIPFK